MSNPTDTYRYPITVDGITFIYHSASTMNTEELEALVIEQESTNELEP